MPDPWPRIFLVGAPKCGTTSLYDALARHPAVRGGRLKEPAFFANDFPAAQIIDTRDAYHENYREAACDGATGIDGSTTYFYSDAAVPNILRQCPAAKFVIVLRPPAEMVFSLFLQQRFSQHEPEKDFEAAWNDHERRWRGGWKGLHRFPHPVCYREAGRLGQYTHRLAGVIPPERLRIVLLEDLKADFRATWRDLLEFLDLPDDGQQKLGLSNPATERRFGGFSRIVLSSHGPLGAIKRALKKRFGFQNTKLMQMAGSLTSKTISDKPALPAPMEAQLVRYFADEVTQLEQMLGRDLSHWRAP